MNSNDIINIVRNRDSLTFQDLKVSYLILKPNAIRHYKEMIQHIESSNYIIIAQYAIFDYDTVNMALHQNQPESMKYIIPIARMYKDFYGNYAILVIVGKKNITYENLCIQIVWLKQTLRAKYDLPYIAYVFNTHLIGQENKHQRISITDVDGNNTKQDKFTDDGTYMMFYTNEVHSPDIEINSVVTEMELLYSMGLINDSLVLPKPIIHNIARYNTFEFIKDLL